MERFIPPQHASHVVIFADGIFSALSDVEALVFEPQRQESLPADTLGQKLTELFYSSQ
jgi:hypothetical protein